jgi:hypothetical protein
MGLGRPCPLNAEGEAIRRAASGHQANRHGYLPILKPPRLEAIADSK